MQWESSPRGTEHQSVIWAEASEVGDLLGARHWKREPYPAATGHTTWPGLILWVSEGCGQPESPPVRGERAGNHHAYREWEKRSCYSYNRCFGKAGMFRMLDILRRLSQGSPHSTSLHCIFISRLHALAVHPSSPPNRPIMEPVAGLFGHLLQGKPWYFLGLGSGWLPCDWKASGRVPSSPWAGNGTGGWGAHPSCSLELRALSCVKPAWVEGESPVWAMFQPSPSPGQ